MTPRKAVAAPLTAFVLHSWDWSETSLIVELFSRERGRVVVAAKGAKRPYSQLRPVLIPFQQLVVQLGRTPPEASAEVHLLRSAERLPGPPMPAGAALFAGFYLNELLLKLLARQDAHENLFDAYAEAVHALQAADEASVQLILRSFELMLLRQLGVLPELNGVTLTVEALDPDGRYSLQAETGVVAVMAGEPGVPGRAMVQLEAALSSGHGAAVRAAARPVLAALRAPLRRVLHYHLGSPVLRTRQVLADVHKLIDPPSARP
ncbi:MAG: DNA repair protein RecO [Rubrivivax sp.]|nr:DNA repair protein RecO [Rubrivivax sp.]